MSNELPIGIILNIYPAQTDYVGFEIIEYFNIS